MPPLTLEQVLARSMRLPKPRARQAAGGGLFASNAATAAAGATGRAQRQHQQTLSFFDMLEREESAQTAGRLSIDGSARMVHNSIDLLSFLKTARRMQDWQDALRAFASATGLGRQLEAVTNSHNGSHTHSYPPLAASSSDATIEKRETSGKSPAGASTTTTMGAQLVPEGSAVSPTPDHVAVLLDTLAAGGQWRLLLLLAQLFGPQLPAATVQAVTVVVETGAAAPRALVEAVQQLSGRPTPTSNSGANAPTSKDAQAVPGYELALTFLAHSTISPAVVPVACYNAILSGCESARDWRGALRVVRSMGPNPLQGWRCPEEGHGYGKEEANGQVNAEISAASIPPAPASSLSSPPPPDVVSYATLIATLEQAGKDSIAAQVLDRLPPLEKEEITASYAALIYVWSNQVCRRQRRRS